MAASLLGQIQHDLRTRHGVTRPDHALLLDQLVAHGVTTGAAAAEGLRGMLLRGARLPHAECQTRLRTWQG
jgi:hypothetical protein